VKETRPRIVLTTVNALVQRVPPRSAFAGAALNLKRGGRQPASNPSPDSWRANGYGRTGTVMEPGEYAVRGGILDLFPSGEAEPLRFDFFGDEIESIRRLDTATQRSGAQVDRLVLRPVGEVFLDPASIERFRTGYRELFTNAAADDPLYVSISAGRRHPGMEHWAGLFHEQHGNAAGLPARCLRQPRQPGGGRAGGAAGDDRRPLRGPARARAHQRGRGALPPGAARPALPRPHARDAGRRGPLMRCALRRRRLGREGIEAGGRQGRLFTEASRRAERLRRLSAEYATPWPARPGESRCSQPGRAARASGSRLLRENRVTREAVEDRPNMRRRARRGAAGGAGVGARLRRALGGGAPLACAGQRLGRHRRASRTCWASALRPPAARRRRAWTSSSPTPPRSRKATSWSTWITASAASTGLKTIEAAGAPHDCLELHYAGGDRLFLPVENIELLTRYGSEETEVQLDKLGGGAWQARKSRMKQRIREMAGALMKIAAARVLKEAPRLVPPEGIYDEFAARFPYDETEDQLNAIDAVLDDLGAGRPMDRLSAATWASARRRWRCAPPSWRP
jgi:transcription-repair coupling factor (superfamily II helicase)